MFSLNYFGGIQVDTEAHGKLNTRARQILATQFIDVPFVP